jgi:hypothetical protein
MFRIANKCRQYALHCQQVMGVGVAGNEKDQPLQVVHDSPRCSVNNVEFLVFSSKSVKGRTGYSTIQPPGLN